MREWLRALLAKGGFGAVFLLTLACSTSGQSVPKVPVNRIPVEQIPVDLDVVVRVDVGRVRSAIPDHLRQIITLLFEAGSWGDSTLLRAALAHSDQLFVGIRPDVNPYHWDYVLVLDGDFRGLETALSQSEFELSRHWGGGFRSFDRPHSFEALGASTTLYLS